MKKAVLFGALLMMITATLLATAAMAQEVKVHAEITSRQEHVENFTDFLDSDAGSDRDNINFGFYRARIGLTADVSDGISGTIELQNHGTWGDSLLPQNAQDPVLGGLWLTSLSGSNGVDLYQAFINWENIGDSLVSAKLGRQEHVLGNELHIGDADFYSGQYFDGLRLNFDFESWDLDGFYYWVAERDVLPGSLGVGDDSNVPVNGGSDDEILAGLTAAFEVGDGHDLEPYLLYKKNGNEADTITGMPKYSAWTVGILYDRPTEHESPFDWSLEAAIQTGDVYVPAKVDLDSNIAEGWFGYTFGDEDASSHRLHVGFLMIGDGDDPEDIEAFQTLFPDTHRRAGLADIFNELSVSNANDISGGDTFHNLTDINFGWEWSNGESQTFGVALHTFSATEDSFLGDEDDIGEEIDLWYTYDHGEHLGFQVGVASFSPGDVFTTDDDDVLRVWGQARFRM